MTNAATLPDRIHLVGSIGLDSVEEVFRTVGKMFGRRLRRVPDGEPGPRRLWVSFQYPLLRSSPFLRPDPSGEVRKTSGFPQALPGRGRRSRRGAFRRTRLCARGARVLSRLLRRRALRRVAAGCALPGLSADAHGRDLCVLHAARSARDRDAYEKAMLREVERLCRGIPHDDLCIQWDFCHEMIILDGQPQDHFPTVKASMDDIMARMRRICAPIPADVELGIHLCYGDFGARHLIEPVDAGKMVEVANAMARSIEHKLAYIHMPVPIERTDDDYYRPLQDLEARAGNGNLSRPRARQGRRRGHPQAHRRLRAGMCIVRRRDRMRHGARAHAGAGRGNTGGAHAGVARAR